MTLMQISGSSKRRCAPAAKQPWCDTPETQLRPVNLLILTYLSCLTFAKGMKYVMKNKAQE